MSHFPWALAIWPFKLHSPYSTKYIGHCISYCLAFTWSWLKNWQKPSKNKNWQKTKSRFCIIYYFYDFLFWAGFPTFRYQHWRTTLSTIVELVLHCFQFSYVHNNGRYTLWFSYERFTQITVSSDLVGLTRTGNCVVPFNDWWALY